VWAGEALAPTHGADEVLVQSLPRGDEQKADEEHQHDDDVLGAEAVTGPHGGNGGDRHGHWTSPISLPVRERGSGLKRRF